MRRATIPPEAVPATTPVTGSKNAATMRPTNTDSAMARTTAAGGRGCSDRKARAMNTNGISENPERYGAGRLHARRIGGVLVVGGRSHQPDHQ
jgi:hypothetical protein